MVNGFRTVHIGSNHRVSRHLPFLARANALNAAVCISDFHLRRQHQTGPEGPVGIGVRGREFGKTENVSVLIQMIPAVAHLRSQHVFPLPQKGGHVKGHELHQLVVIRPAGVQHVIPHLLPVDVKIKLSQAADLRHRGNRLSAHLRPGSGIKRPGRALRNPYRLHAVASFLIKGAPENRAGFRVPP